MSLSVVKKKVSILDVTTSLNVPSERILNGALDKNLKDVVVLGCTNEGEYYFASSVADGGTVLWMMEKLKKQLLEI